MTTISAVFSGGVYSPASVPAPHYAVDFNGASYCFVLGSDLTAPDARVLANPSKLVKQLNAAPVVVPASMFGLHLLSPSTSVGNITTGYLRSHDAGVRWDQIATSDGVYSWSVLDAWLVKANALGAKPLFNIFGTPNWCSSAPAQPSAYPGSPGIAAPPTSITKLTDFLTALVARYPAQIKYFEIWNEVNIPVTGGNAAYWSGTNAQLLDICVAVYDVVKAAIPSATVLGPSTQGWGQGLEEVAINPLSNPSIYLTALLAATNTAGTRSLASACDLISMHSYYPDGLTRQWQGMAAAIKGVLSAAGVVKNIFDTETGLVQIQNDGSLYSDAKYLRLLQQNMICAAALGLQGQCWYAYDHVNMGFNNRPSVVAGYLSLLRLLSGATIGAGALQYPDGTVRATVNGQLVIV